MEPLLFKADTTFRWSCRKGDYLIWFRSQGFFSPEDQTHRIEDLWEMKEGNFVTITNRWQDLPSWFELHPLETSGSLVSWMQAKLDSGYAPPDPVGRPNLWRVFAGDRLAWVGPSRPDLKADNGILGLIDFRENALVVGEPLDFSKGFPNFGRFDQDVLPPAGTLFIYEARKAISSIGMPRVMAADGRWRIG